MRAFITGASGFIGKHLARHLLQRGWQVRALIHNQKIIGLDGLETIDGHIRNLTLLKEALSGTDVLFHLASALGASQIGRREFYAVNTEGTRTVLEAARENGIRKVLHFSSAGALGHVRPGEIAGEDYPPDPRDIYDKSKLAGEQVALDFARRGMDVVIIRPGWVYGPEDRRTLKLIRAIARGRYILVSKGKTLQTPVFVLDLVQGTMLCAEKGRMGEIYHLAGPEVLTVKIMVKTIASAAGKKIPRFTLPLLPIRSAAWLLGKTFSLFKKEAPLNPSRLSFFIHPKPLSIQKAVGELGYSPKTSFQKGMFQTVAWYKEAGWL
jgi:nucleoside-diphosphate-sugar epimerase